MERMRTRMWRWVEKNEFLVVVVLLVALARIPSLFEPGWYGDEGIYLVLGEALRKGLVWYRDIHDNKPPLLYILAALTGSVTYFRALLLVWMIATTVVFADLAKKLINGVKMWRLAVVIFAIMTTIPLLEGNIANAEIFMILPTLLGVKKLLAKKIGVRGVFAGGVWFSLAFLFKVPAVFEAVGLGVWLVISQLGNKKRLVGLLGAMMMGFLLPVLASVLYYFLVGAGKEYINAVFLQNIGYLSSWQTGTHSGGTSQSGLGKRTIALASLVVGFLIFNRKTGIRFKLVWLWLVFALFGALLSERPYPHYLIQIVASLSLLVAVERKVWQEWLSLGIGLLLVIGAVVNYKFYVYPVFGYYADFVKLAVGKMSMVAYEDKFDWRVSRNRKLIPYLKWTTDTNERIFVWGDEPFVYALADRLPVGKYAVAYHVVDFDQKENTRRLLEQTKPQTIVKVAGEKRELPGLDELLLSSYVIVKQIDDATIYKRL